MVCLTGVGRSNFTADCLILDGSPADSSLTDQMLELHKQISGYYPLKTTLDGRFASKRNLVSAKDIGIMVVCFSKKRGLKVEDMCRRE